MSCASIEKTYREAADFLVFWFGQACPVPAEVRKRMASGPPPRTFPEVIAIRAALDQSPQRTQRVKRQLKRLLIEPSFAKWAKRTAYLLADDADVAEWAVQIIRGLTVGLRLRDDMGRVGAREPFELPRPDGIRRRGWHDRKQSKYRGDA